MKLWFSILLIGLTTVVFSQHDFVIEEIDGKKFYVHTVEKGHTLYSISKLYKSEVETITSSNPGADKGLSIGQVLRIPVASEINEKTWDNPVRLEGEFLVHRVKRGETLFGIGQLYTADVNDILELNPSANQGINPGDELKIRSNDVDESTLDESVSEIVGLRHRIVPGETFYSLTKKYDITIEELKAANGGLPEGLRAGDYLTIPVEEEARDPLADNKPVESDFVLPIDDPQPKKDQYRISMMLPLYLDWVDSTGYSKYDQLRSISLDMYRGASIALDSLELIGLSAEVKIIDVNDTDYSVDQALTDPFVKESHLIVGPLQRSQLEQVCEYSSRKGVHVVCPTPQPNRLLLKSPNLSKVQGGVSAQMEALAQYAAKSHYMDRIIMVNSLDTRDARSVQVFRETVQDILSSNVMAAQKDVVEVKASGKSVGDIGSQLSNAFRNVIVLPTKDKSLIQDLLTKLALADEELDIVVLGTADWMNMNFIDMDYKNQFKLTIPALGHVDYNSPQTIKFVESFRRQYAAEPDLYAFVGHDIMIYYGSGLLYHGVNFPNKFAEINQSGLLMLGFDYKKTGMTSGFENYHSSILSHRDFVLTPVE